MSQRGLGNGRSDGAGSRATSGERATARTERLPWFPVYTGEMLTETRGWPVLAIGAYYMLLAAQWDLGLLPRSPRRLRTLIGATPREWRTAWPLIESKFPITDGGRQNPTLESRRRKSLDLRDRRHAASMKAHGARWRDRRATTEAHDA